ncbi:hypothetical protein SCOCK_210059 [Actinacidiphila cocklensis]|uniref:Uncharacterized protein n=1 Tax=Actinacidiphila cocklensis TaxID=887465 RepID=A0A9W4GQI3_9ACTN|nr:hypothetical protein SCOCK_210059 [Actinacidiphila cocklensis]
MISSARSSARFICGPDTRTGPRLSRSSSETRSPGGTVSKESSTARCPVLSIPYRLSHSRWFAASRTEATSRARRLAPGSSTRPSRNQPAAASNNAFGPSPVVHARASSQTTSSSRTSAKSRQPPASWISPACLRAVPSRSPYSFRHETSSISNCSARYSATSAGTCRGSRHEPAQEPHARELDREPEPVMGPALGLHRLPVRVVQEEVPLQLRPRGRLVKRPVPGRLLVRQELDRHNSSPKIDNSNPRRLRRPITPGQSPKRTGEPLAHDLTPRSGSWAAPAAPTCWSATSTRAAPTATVPSQPPATSPGSCSPTPSTYGPRTPPCSASSPQPAPEMTALTRLTGEFAALLTPAQANNDKLTEWITTVRSVNLPHRWPRGGHLCRGACNGAARTQSTQC